MLGAADDEPVSGQPLSLVEAGRLLDEVVDVHEVLTDERVAAAPGSSVAEELSGARNEPCPVGVWGEEAVRSAYALGTLNYRIALDHAVAIAAMTKSGRCAVSASVVTRGTRIAASLV